MPRTEFGVERPHDCSCRDCTTKCRFMPGFLVPADLDRIIPPEDPFTYAYHNLLASPGALVMKDLEMFRIPTLVPAVKEDGSCIHLGGGKRHGYCGIHHISPFGCAFFSCAPEVPGLANKGILAVYDAWYADPPSLYRRLWEHLAALDKFQLAPELLRQRMEAAV